MTSDPSAGASRAPRVDATRLEFLRSGIGLVLETPDEGAVQAVYVSRGADDRTAARECTCRRGRRGRPCGHAPLLEEQVDACHESWGGRSWLTVFEATGWHRLARACFDAARVDCADARATAVSADGRAGHRLESGRDGSLVALVSQTESGVRLLDRCGLGRLGQAEGSRARVLAQLQRLQCTDAERAMNERGSWTGRQAFENSVHYRVAYHAVREWADGGTFHPLVDTAAASFVLVHRARDGAERLRLVVPGDAVEAVLGLLRELQPDRRDLDVHPIPLRSLFKVTRATELDVDVRPVLELLQRDGESRFFEREDALRFRFGRLVYLPELEVLAELERPGRERRFAAPVRMTLQPSRVPAFVQEMEARASAVVDAGLRRLTVFREIEALRAEPLERDEEGYWTKLDCAFGGAAVPLADLLRAKQRGLAYLEVAPGWVDLQAPALDPLWSLAAAGAASRVRDDAIHLSPRELLRVAGAAPAPPEVKADSPAAAALQALLALQPSRRRPTPAGLRSELRPYQRIGVDWLLFLHDNGLAGLLCDEMGLGKTHQVMAFLLSLVEHERLERPFLVVAPTSVVAHWRDKLRRHAPSLSVTIYHGPERSLPSSPRPGHVLVTSYGVLRNDLEKLNRLRFGVAVLDEVQQVKNRDTHAHRAVADLAAAMKIGLTGTPIENDEDELRALLDLVLPGQFAGPLSPRRLQPFVMRRLKRAVLHELPEKIEDVRRCPLSDEQRALYRQALDTRGAALRAQLLRTDQPVPYLHVFALLNQLKRICDHPALARDQPAGYLDAASGKWDLFVEILEEALDGGQKVVAFSQYLGMLEIMERHLRAQGVGFAKLTGATADRGRVVDRFNADPACRVFLGSLKAGGTGIDLVGGSVVVHYDRWWNAAREDQATDRVHRIGQRRAVQVFKLIAEGTLEERIDAIIAGKRQLLEASLAVDDPHLAKVFSREELLDLLREPEAGG